MASNGQRRDARMELAHGSAMDYSVYSFCSGRAVWSIVSQRSIARKRAPVDVFIKTEMDEKMIVAYDRFHTGLNEMRKANLIRRGLDGTLVRP
jgi:hypothetical protein